MQLPEHFFRVSLISVIVLSFKGKCLYFSGPLFSPGGNRMCSVCYTSKQVGAYAVNKPQVSEWSLLFRG